MTDVEPYIQLANLPSFFTQNYWKCFTCISIGSVSPDWPLLLTLRVHYQCGLKHRLNVKGR